MKTKDLHNNKSTKVITDHFKGQSKVGIKDVKEYFRKIVPGIQDNAIYARIHELKNKGIIAAVARGVYTFAPKPLWIPSPDKDIRKVEQTIRKQFISADILLWDTTWLNEFTNLQAFRKLIIIEPEEIIAENVFYFLKEKGFKEVYFKPGTKEIELYAGNSPLTYIIKSLVSKSPVLKKESRTPGIEKILVDLYCDKELFYSYQDDELLNIWTNIFKKYLVNKSTLFSYSRRRGKQKDIEEFMNRLHLTDQA
ncbi:MAG: hypothetical protein ISS19_03910 [Bacteroidales bacterium]|nr:hypothetical protein [Bacteroidales bacterium]